MNKSGETIKEMLKRAGKQQRDDRRNHRSDCRSRTRSSAVYAPEAGTLSRMHIIPADSWHAGWFESGA